MVSGLEKDVFESCVLLCSASKRDSHGGEKPPPNHSTGVIAFLEFVTKAVGEKSWRKEGVLSLVLVASSVISRFVFDLSPLTWMKWRGNNSLCCIELMVVFRPEVWAIFDPASESQRLCCGRDSLFEEFESLLHGNG